MLRRVSRFLGFTRVANHCQPTLQDVISFNGKGDYESTLSELKNLVPTLHNHGVVLIENCPSDAIKRAYEEYTKQDFDLKPAVRHQPTSLAPCIRSIFTCALCPQECYSVAF